MAKETDFMKVGLYALAGFGAYALYNRYMGEDKGSEVVVVEDDATSSFTGTKWQQSGRNRETMWQEGGVFENASGRGRKPYSWSDVIRPRGESKRPYSWSSVINPRTGMDARVTKGWSDIINPRTGMKTGRRGWSDIINPRDTGYRNMQGTDWQRSGQALSSGTNWQDASMNASGCGSCGA